MPSRGENNRRDKLRVYTATSGWLYAEILAISCITTTLLITAARELAVA